MSQTFRQPDSEANVTKIVSTVLAQGKRGGNHAGVHSGTAGLPFERVHAIGAWHAPCTRLRRRGGRPVRRSSAALLPAAANVWLTSYPAGQHQPAMADLAAHRLSNQHREIAALTYGWGSPDEPDVSGEYLAAVRRFLHSGLGAHVTAVFWERAFAGPACRSPPARPSAGCTRVYMHGVVMRAETARQTESGCFCCCKSPPSREASDAEATAVGAPSRVVPGCAACALPITQAEPGQSSCDAGRSTAGSADERIALALTARQSAGLCQWIK